MQNALIKLSEHEFVLEVYVHSHPIIIKILSVFFFLSLF